MPSLLQKPLATPVAELTWDSDDIAVILKKSRPVIHRMLRQQPEALPPPCRRVGKYYLWLPDQVMAWLRGEPIFAAEPTPAKRGRGRPRKDAALVQSQHEGGAA